MGWPLTTRKEEYSFTKYLQYHNMFTSNGLDILCNLANVIHLSNILTKAKDNSYFNDYLP